MSEITIDLGELDYSIAQLKVLQHRWGNSQTAPPATVGGGQTVAQLEALVKAYQELNAHMVTLAANTAAFLTDVWDSFQESDQKAASEIRK